MADVDTARIAVRDYGPGVPPEALPKIFQPFFRVDDSRYTATGGVGLGLAIASRAIGLHHGKLWAENTTPGLRVWIELPLVGWNRPARLRWRVGSRCRSRAAQMRWAVGN